MARWRERDTQAHTYISPIQIFLSLVIDALKTVGASGEYCTDVSAIDDDIIESEEEHQLMIDQDRTIQESTLPVQITDNDCKHVNVVRPGASRG